MNNQEAKFILGTYRPNGGDARDPMFTAALAQAEHDPELRAWLEGQRKFDAAVFHKLGELSPPAELRAAILAGGRASQPRRRWWGSTAWMAAAAAAAVAVIATLAFTVGRGSSAPAVAELTAFAMQDLANEHGGSVGSRPEIASVRAQLGAVSLPLTAEGRVGLDLDELRRKNCRQLKVAGRDVFEICFQRDGTWYHLYAARREDFSTGVLDARSLIESRGEFVATAWADSKNVYALVARAGQEALRRVI